MKLDFPHTRLQPAGIALISNLLWSLDIPGSPKGTASLSPGLRAASYPGFKHLQPDGVAQISNLLYRRLPVGRACDEQSSARQIGNLRYGRLEICATCLPRL